MRLRTVVMAPATLGVLESLRRSAAVAGRSSHPLGAFSSVPQRVLV